MKQKVGAQKSSERLLWTHGGWSKSFFSRSIYSVGRRQVEMVVRVSIRDVSALAGVSAATVSNVFSGRKPVNDDLRDRVRAAASQLGYLPHRGASQLRSGRTNVVAVLVPDLTDKFFATIVARFETLAQADGYDVVVASSRDVPSIEASRLEALLSWRPAGVIAVPCSNDVPQALVREAGRIPFVLVDRVAVPCALADTVTIDNSDAGAVAARHLVDNGHRDIVIAASRMNIVPIEERVSSASEHIFRTTGNRPTILELGTNVDEGAAVFARWLERHDLPDAVLATTNVTTLAVLATLADFQFSIPGQVSMVAFDDDVWMRARNTGLTAIRQPLEEIADAAWNRLRIRMEQTCSPAPVATILNAVLVVRSSVNERSPRSAGVLDRNSGGKVRKHPVPGGRTAGTKPIH